MTGMSKDLAPLSQPDESVPSREEPRRPSIWSWPDAAPGARAAAFVLDCLILAAIWGLLQVTGDRFLDSWATDLAQTLALFSYWIGFQLAGGRTVGQRVVGLRLITLEAHELDEGVPLLRLALREFVYFPISVLGLGLGVLMILLRKDRMALHDLLTRTRVVALSQEPSSEPVRMSVVLSVLAAISTVAVIGFFSIVYWTPYPLRSTVHSLELLGYRFGRMTGSLSNGFRIERMAFENDELALELRDIRFRYRAGEGGAVVDNLTVGEAVVSFHKMPDGIQWPSVNLRLLIDSADVKNVTFQAPSRPSLFFKRLFLSEIALDQRQGSITMGRIWIDSEAVAADIQDFVVRGSAVGTAKPSHLTLKPAFDTGVIASPIDFTFEGFYQDGVYDEFHVEACKGRVKLSLNGRGGEIGLNNFTPAHFFRTELPLWNFNVAAKLDLLHGKISDARGSVDLRNYRFTIEGSGFQHQRGRRQYVIQPQIPEDWNAALEGRAPAALLGASELKSVRAILADIFFQLPVASLSTSEVEMVDHDEKYFLFAPSEDEDALSPRAPTSEKH